MTVTNHVMTGALITLIVKQSTLAIPLALISHFVIAAIPHYGYGSLPADQRDGQKHFLKKQIADTIVDTRATLSILRFNSQTIRWAETIR